MKKILTSFISICLMFCVLFTMTACGDSKDNYVGRMFYGGDLYRLKYDEDAYKNEKLSASESIDYLTNIKNANPNPTTPNLENGVRVYLDRSVDRGGLTISNFDMYLKEVEGTLIAQGSFTVSQGNAKAESKFYHDGTYLGVETIENDVVDKQKEEMSINTGISNLIGIPDFIQTATDYLGNLPTIDDLIEDLQNQNDPDFKCLDVSTCVDSNGVCKDFISIGTSLRNFGEYAFDMSYNFIGYLYGDMSSDYWINSGIEVKASLCVEITNQEITMPSDFDTWTTRPAV